MADVGTKQGLTERQKRVYKLWRAGESVPAIMRALGVTRSRVYQLVAAIRAKGYRLEHRVEPRRNGDAP